jgi:hypothetical protein
MLETRIQEHTFSIEMKSKTHVKNISISDEAQDRVLFEGNLGKLHDLSLIEDNVLEFIGSNGIIRVAVTEKQIRKALMKASKVRSQLQRGEL